MTTQRSLIRTTVLERRVRRGARQLDLVGPDDWIDLIDLDRLNVELGTRCVVGQLYGSYAYSHMRITDRARGWLRLVPRTRRADYIGLSLDRNHGPYWRLSATYTELTDAWRREILRRRSERTRRDSETDHERCV